MICSTVIFDFKTCQRTGCCIHSADALRVWLKIVLTQVRLPMTPFYFLFIFYNVYIFLIRITSRVDLAMSGCPSVRLPVCPYERCDLENYKSCYTRIRHADSRDSYATQVYFVSEPRPIWLPQTAHKLQKIVHMNADISERVTRLITTAWLIYIFNFNFKDIKVKLSPSLFFVKTHLNIKSFGLVNYTIQLP